MITFTSNLWMWNGETSAGRWYFLTVPDAQSVEIRTQAMALPRGFGSVRVEVAIGDVRWRTSLFPQKEGGYLLPVKASVRRDAEIAAGDAVTLQLNLI